ncbi:MAG: hydrolase [Actinomycetia bacterium]|nr:hydrolase [Actinomycetes bacterium]
MLTIVGAAIMDDQGRVLGAERAAPPALAGRWEFPGGKVEPGEEELAALHRECEEELGVGIEVLARLGGDVTLPTGAVLKVWIARLVRGEPQALEHSELRWLPREELHSVPWLPADAPLVDALAAQLDRRTA